MLLQEMISREILILPIMNPLSKDFVQVGWCVNYCFISLTLFIESSSYIQAGVSVERIKQEIEAFKHIGFSGII